MSLIEGKSTLADRFLELTNVIPRESQKQYLDKLDVERLRGITVKAQACTMFYKGHMMNLVDTPGHVDFCFEVKRSLSAVNGILLLVAANQGIQAQTLANFWLAFSSGLEIVPVINKIDMENANIAYVEDQLMSHFGFSPNDIIKISAKTGQNVENLLDAILERIPAPNVDPDALLRAQIIDSWFDEQKGIAADHRTVIALVFIKSGVLREGTKIQFFHTKKTVIPIEIGILHPEKTSCRAIYAGQIGYIQCNIKCVNNIIVGDTFYEPNDAFDQPITSITPIKPTIYAGLFPVNSDKYTSLSKALTELSLNDASISLAPEMSVVLGQGWKIGFLGRLHMEVFGQRLDHEYKEDVIFTNPSVEYKAEIKNVDSIRKKRYNGAAQISIISPDSFPIDYITDIERFFEPMASVCIICPTEYVENCEKLCLKIRGEQDEITTFDSSQSIMKWRLPLYEVYLGFFDEVKSITSGMASMDLKESGYRECSLTKISIFLNEKCVTEFSQICPEILAKSTAKNLVDRIKREIPRQMFEVTIKATLGNSKKPIAQTKIAAFRKDFTQLMKGNLVPSRLQKKLKHQEEGKTKLKSIGSLRITKESFINIFKK